MNMPQRAVPKFERRKAVPTLPARRTGGMKLTMELVNFLRDRDDIERYERVMRQSEDDKRTRHDPGTLFWVNEAGR